MIVSMSRRECICGVIRHVFGGRQNGVGHARSGGVPVRPARRAHSGTTVPTPAKPQYIDYTQLFLSDVDTKGVHVLNVMP
jgi:hypothetical protein